MNVEQIYTGCLAQGAYYIESQGEIAIIDPLREVQPYLDKAEALGGKIKYIFETHFHADFVSGHLTLSQKSGAPIVYGPQAQPSFEHYQAQDGEEFSIGQLTLKVLHTPGHTMESTTYLLRDENGKDQALFTGDTLFLGDVGRPDLAQKAASMTQEELAGLLYDSLHQKIMPLADDITVYPGHGAGSACGKNMMDATVDTLGNQKKVNYALRADMTKDEFIQELTDGLLPPPAYFPLNVKLNKEGYDSIDDVMQRGLQALSPDAFEAAAAETGAVVLDVRHEDEFVKGFVPKSTFIGLDGDFAPWVGALIGDVAQPILLVAPEGRAEEAITRLARVGFDRVLGYLEGGFPAWQAAGKEVDQIPTISSTEAQQRYQAEKLPVVDLRKPGEYTSEHVEDARNIPLAQLNDKMSELPEQEALLHCQGGYRSVIASSILQARGLRHFVNVAGGADAMKENGWPLTDYICPSTLK
jgi:glyoxylase-like metal-dependent hydrolase (beta-lactamase superfamily II)/rhodanese-related sulfurtransferase